jgi:hypothetical protein
MLLGRAGRKEQLAPAEPGQLHRSPLPNSDVGGSIGPLRPLSPAQSMRVPWVIQFVSQVFPPSVENACSQVYERGLMFDHR